jgi:hypothetical protein
MGELWSHPAQRQNSRQLIGSTGGRRLRANAPIESNVGAVFRAAPVRKRFGQIDVPLTDGCGSERSCQIGGKLPVLEAANQRRHNDELGETSYLAITCDASGHLARRLLSLVAAGSLSAPNGRRSGSRPTEYVISTLAQKAGAKLSQFCRPCIWSTHSNVCDVNQAQEERK